MSLKQSVIHSETSKKKPSIKQRAISLAKNIVFFLVIFIALQAFMQRNMATGVAPAFNTTLINEKPVSLDIYKGKPLMLHFWADWCPKCKLEEGSISDINNDGTPLVTVAFQSGDKTNVQAFLSKRGIENWPVIVDQSGSLAQKYGVTGVPATFFIDAQGKIRFKTIGLTSKWGMKIRMWLMSFY
jgi:peroxiredoxin